MLGTTWLNVPSSQAQHRSITTAFDHPINFQSSRGRATSLGNDNSIPDLQLLTETYHSSSRELTLQHDLTLNHILTTNYTKERKTKIICAIGPACNSIEKLGELLDAGMNVARLNFSHGDHQLHYENLCNLRKAITQRKNCYCAILLDTKGPEIRTGKLQNGTPIQLVAGQLLEITPDINIEGTSTRISCTYTELVSSVSIGSRILCDDGTLTLSVVECNKKLNFVTVRVVNSHILGEKKNMHLPGAAIKLSGITSKDIYDLKEFAIPHKVDIVSGSFIRSAANVRAIRECLVAEGCTNIRVHAKIESLEALRNIDEILAEADGVHVSRGDLGMELSPEHVFLAQKMIIRKANILGKPVVTSTQMLQSMTKNSSPSRAECTDVANAVLDGTDCVMLSGETANGKYPRESVETMSKICIEAESCIDYGRLYNFIRAATQRPFLMTEALAASAVEIAIDVKATLIISLTESGYSTKLLAKYRPKAQILGITTSERTARQLTGVSRGVASLLVDNFSNVETLILRAIIYSKSRRWIKTGDMVVVIHGQLDSMAGRTSVVNIIQVAGSGYATSPTFTGLVVPDFQMPSLLNLSIS